jgi:hypothetical protein
MSGHENGDVCPKGKRTYQEKSNDEMETECVLKANVHTKRKVMMKSTTCVVG